MIAWQPDNTPAKCKVILEPRNSGRNENQNKLSYVQMGMENVLNNAWFQKMQQLYFESWVNWHSLFKAYNSFLIRSAPQQVIGIISSVMKSSNWILMGNHNRLQNTSENNEFSRSLAFHIIHWPILLLSFPRPDETQNIYKAGDKLMT